MNDRIRLTHTPSGCWQILRDDYPLAIYPKHMWTHAYAEARREAIWNNLSIIGIEMNP